MRTTISFSDVVNGWALELMAEDGYNDNFSAFLAALVREEKKRRSGGSGGMQDIQNSAVPSAISPDAATKIPVSYSKPAKKKAVKRALPEKPMEETIVATRSSVGAARKTKAKGA